MRRSSITVLVLLLGGCARMETSSQGDDGDPAHDAARRDAAAPVLLANSRAKPLPPLNSELPADVLPASYEFAAYESVGFRRLPSVDEGVSWQADATADGSTSSNAHGANPQAERALTISGFFEDVLADYGHYYSPTSLAALAAGFGVGAALANTSVDESFRDLYQENVRDTKTDEWSEAMHTPTVLGNGMMVLPVFAATAMAGEMMDEMPMMSVAGDWGEQSLRTALVGFPSMLLMQKVTGASRPEETGHDSQWRFWNDSNGVSGHSFMGAVPFLTAAKMTHNPWCKATFYLASTGAGLSRINDDRHYASQVLLGWWMAYVAADAVMQTENGRQEFALVPLETPDGAGIGVELRR